MSESNDITQMFQALVELTDAIHWEMDLASGKFTYVSPQIESILGYPPGKWDTFEAWADTVHPDDRVYAVKYCQDKTKNSEDHVFIYRVLNASGEIVWLRDVVKVVSKDGKPSKLFGVMFDISAQKRAEAELKTYAIIFHNIAEGVCLIGVPDLTIKWTNPALETMFGYDKEELRGKFLDTLLASIDVTSADSRKTMVKLLKDTGKWQGEARGIRKDGTQFWCQINISRLDHPEYGNVYVFVYSDITERKQAEESLKESERKYRTIISSSPIGIVVCNSDGQAISTNRAMADIVGATEEQILNQNYHNIESWKSSGLMTRQYGP
jgi:PAS domain S-box-containing protein